MYLDQIVVATEYWGGNVALMLLDEAKRISPKGLELLVNKDNARAIRFYEKHGFAYAGEDKNPVSGKPVDRMAWRPVLSRLHPEEAAHRSRCLPQIGTKFAQVGYNQLACAASRRFMGRLSISSIS